MMKLDRYKWVIKGILLLLILVLPQIIRSNYVLHLMIIILIYGLLAGSLNIITGFAGQMSLCHGALFGMGAYTSAILSMRYDLPIIATIFIGASTACLLGVVLIGLPSLRTRGIYFAVTTLGFQQIAFLLFKNLVGVTGGPSGLPRVPQIVLFGFKFCSRNHILYLIMIILLIVTILINLICSSRVGLEWRVLKSDDIAAASVGVNTYYSKVLAFAISAFIAGLAGAFYAHYIGFISPDSFSGPASIMVVTMAILGGLGTITGPLIGAAIITFLMEYLRMLGEWRLVVYGVILIYLIIYAPNGITGIYKNLTAKICRKTKKLVPGR